MGIVAFSPKYALDLLEKKREKKSPMNKTYNCSYDEPVCALFAIWTVILRIGFYNVPVSVSISLKFPELTWEKMNPIKKILIPIIIDCGNNVKGLKCHPQIVIVYKINTSWLS